MRGAEMQKNLAESKDDLVLCMCVFFVLDGVKQKLVTKT